MDTAYYIGSTVAARDSNTYFIQVLIFPLHCFRNTFRAIYSQGLNKRGRKTSEISPLLYRIPQSLIFFCIIGKILHKTSWAAFFYSAAKINITTRSMKILFIVNKSLILITIIITSNIVGTISAMSTINTHCCLWNVIIGLKKEQKTCL